MNLPFLSERMEIWKIKELVTNLHDKTEYVMLIRNLKQALNHELILKKVYRVITINKKDWLKPYIDMNTELRQKAKNNVEKDFFKLMNNAVFGKLRKMWENIEILNLSQQKRQEAIYIRTKLSYYKNFYKKFISNRNKKTQILINKPAYLGLLLFRFI